MRLPCWRFSTLRPPAISKFVWMSSVTVALYFSSLCLNPPESLQSLSFEFDDAGDAVTLGLLLEAYAKRRGAPLWSFDPNLPDTAWSGLESLGGSTASPARPARRGARHDLRYASRLSDEEVTGVLQSLAQFRIEPGRLRLVEPIA